MRLRTYSLLLHFLRNPSAHVALFVERECPPHIELLENERTVFSLWGKERSAQGERVVREDWRDGKFWRNVALPTGRVEVVFDCAESGIPSEAFKALRARGIERVICFDRGDWRSVVLGGKMLSAEAKRGLRSWLESVETTIALPLRKALLKLFARDVRSVSLAGFRHDRECCFLADVPAIHGFADVVGRHGEHSMFFEETTQLTLHAPHDDIRRYGRGRMSHWETQIFLSTTDNTDPNHNGRRYRVVLFGSKKRALKSVFRAAFAQRPLSRVISDAPPLIVDQGSSFVETLEQFVAKDEARGFMRDGSETEQIALFTTDLSSGGAEHQICLLAQMLKRRGFSPEVLTYRREEASSLHYAPLLRREQIPHRFISEPEKSWRMERMITRGGIEDLWLLRRLPEEFRDDVFNVYTHLMSLQPQILYCSLDHSNVIGALAGWLAGVPRILLSTRNVNPTHFPFIWKNYYRDVYRTMAKSPRVQLVANSRRGAESYAEWLGVDVSRFGLVPNGVDSRRFHRPDDTVLQAFRKEVGVPIDAPLIGGVFRLSAEKRPEMFVEVIERVIEWIPTAHAVIAGVGGLEERVRADIAKRGLENRVHLIGRRMDVPVVLSASDVVLLTSEVEGTPNVLLESSLLGTPAVATDVGAVSEVILDGESGFVCSAKKSSALLEQLTGGCVMILHQKQLREQFGDRARTHVETAYSLDRMLERHLELFPITQSPLRRRA
ncbi:MAG: glycosyltransferase [Deltaproteobacteria bacterium]|nr:glycosyltransferase [Deltaproteobacteria bacterium]